MAEPVAVDYISRRRPQPPEELTPETLRWLETLPEGARPRRLPSEFPRIANGIARRWTTPSFCLVFFEDLLVDRRGNRRGFPLPVMLEIAELKSHFQLTVHPMPRTVWEEIVQRGRA
jgi:hypothetical protein